MPFSTKSSRNSSKHTSMESIPDHLSQENQSQEDVRIYLTTSEMQDLLNKASENDDLTATLQNPLGKLLIQMQNSHNKWIDSGKVDGEKISVSDLSKAFQENLSITQRNLKTAMEKSASTVKDELYKRDLLYHTHNPLIKCPDKFASHPTLTSISRQIESNKLFPQGRQKFSGGSNPPITEWIYSMNGGQAKLNLSEEEFKDKLLSSTTGEVHSLIRSLIQEEDSIGGIYHKLLTMYDFTIKPDKAKTELLNYKIPRSSTLHKGQCRIIELSSAAARIFPEGNMRKQFSNIEACTALIRALPYASSTIVNNAYSKMLTVAAENGTTPLFTDLISLINPYHESINDDIKRNGKVYLLPSLRPYRHLRDHPYQAGKFISSSGRRTLQTNSLDQQPYGSQPRTNQQNKFLNTLYCSLCGKNTHRASDSCYAMRDDSGRVVNVTPSQVPCTICEKKMNKKLYHPLKFCFNRLKAQATSNIATKNLTQKYNTRNFKPGRNITRKF